MNKGIARVIHRSATRPHRLYWLAVALLFCIACTMHPREGQSGELDSSASDTVRREARLVFAGDLMQHMPQVRAAQRPNGRFDYSESFRYVKPLFEQADYAILNFETTLTPTTDYHGYPTFRSPGAVADALRDIGIDAVMFANNHICDNGRTGIEYTTRRFDSLGIVHTGAFVDSSRICREHPLLFQAGGLRFALFNYTYDTNGMPIPKGMIVNLIDTNAISRDLSSVNRKHIDCVIVFFHWGIEYARRPNDEQRRLAALCHRLGAEIVIGSHPHVIQPIEAKRDNEGVVRSVTVYSLGNLVSNQKERYRNGGLIVTLDIKKERNGALRIAPAYTPGWVCRPGGYRIIPPSAADSIALPADLRATCMQFFEDTRALLEGNKIFEERVR